VAVTNEQVMILMKELSKGAALETASAKAGMTRQTGAKYRRLGRLPSELAAPRTWRTRDNPFAEEWAKIEAKLQADEGLQAKTLFDWLTEQQPGRWEPGQLRTLQRHIRRWRVVSGKKSTYELFFPQRHRAGEAMQVDFTHTGELEMTMGGAPYAPLLCHPVLPYSGWEWATVCQSESILALRLGIQDAAFRLGCVPEWCQTDNSTGATHRIGKEGGKRPFNQDYLDLMTHLGMKPRTIEVGKKQQNGSVEARNGVIKRMLDQQLRLRGSRDFADETEFVEWLNMQLDRANARRSARLREDLRAMRPLAASRLPEFVLLRGIPVSSHATINVKENIYSVPPSLKEQPVDVRVYEKRVEVWYAGAIMWSTPRLIGRSRHAINYRHVIWSLVRKPGAFARYRFRDDLFPTLTFRRAYEVLERQHAGIKADAAYLRILHLAASTLESEVEAAIAVLLEQGLVPSPDAVKELVSPEKPSVPKLHEPRVDLTTFDALLHEVAL
jgi:hypothetical protein